MLWDIKVLKQHLTSMLFILLTILTKHVGMNCVMNMDLCYRWKPTETHGTWQKLGSKRTFMNIPASRAEWLPNCLGRANMFQRDKNHASVVIGLVVMNLYAGKDVADMADYFRSVDNTRQFA